MSDTDLLHRFVFEHLPIRGQIVHVNSAWQAILQLRTYPSTIRDTLGEAVAASALLAATLKFDGCLSLQLQGPGPLHLLLAQCTNNFGVRGLARYRQAIDSRDLSALSGDGELSVTLDTDGQQRYQGRVPLIGARLAQCLEAYFQHSEQLPTRFWMHADNNGACGLLLQRLPSDRQGDDVDDAWRRVQLLADTLTSDELARVSHRDILRRLYHEDDVRLFESQPVYFRCTCSRERVSGMLLALGRNDVDALLEQHGRVEVCCEFCGRVYRFDAVDVGRVFAGISLSAGGAVH